jgi:putative mRNA 3-end processing factor
METTYANEDHSERMELERSLVEAVTEVVEKGGIALIPAFSIGRSQEIACVLAAHHFEHPVTMDGMSRAANRVIMDNTEFLQDPHLFMNAVHGATWVDGWRDRRTATKKPGVVISPAGMLKGGPAAFYISKLGKKAQNAVFLVSYQIPGTPGSELLKKGACVIDGKVQKIKAQVRHFDFSSHCGASQLQEAVKRLKGNPKVFTVHGAEGNCERFAKWVKSETTLDAAAPNAGDKATV